jgi:hypothetical protein
MRSPALGLCALALFLGGCGFPSRHGSTLSFPSPISTDVPAAAPAPITNTSVQTPVLSTNLSGVVKAGGVPQAGATVVVVADGFVIRESRSTVSDNSGRYDIPSVALRMALGPLISAHQPGYFTDVKWVTTAANQAVDFDLSPVTYTQVGTVVRSRMVNGVCEGVGYGSVPCHRVAIVAPATGTLEVTVAAPAITGDLDIWGPKGASAAYFPCPCPSPFRTGLAVEKGETYEIRATMTPEIELTAALLPASR